MLALILAAVLSSRGVPATAVENTVIIEGRPGCTALALNGDPRQPVIMCVNK